MKTDQRHPGALGGDFIAGQSQLVHRRALVHFVKHGPVDHRATREFCVVSLPPVTAAAAARDLVQGPPFKLNQEKPGKMTGMYSRPFRYCRYCSYCSTELATEALHAL